MDRSRVINLRTALIHEIFINSPAVMAQNLGPASDKEYEAYLARYEQMKRDLAVLNEQLGLPEESQDSVEE